MCHRRKPQMQIRTTDYSGTKANHNVSYVTQFKLFTSIFMAYLMMLLTADHNALQGSMISNRVAMACCKVLSWHVSEDTEGNCGSIFSTLTFQI